MGLLSGNIISPVGDVYKGALQGYDLGNGRLRVPLAGVAILTSALQTNIPVQIFPPFNREMSETYPPIRLQAPIGAQVISASFRLPGLRAVGSQYEWGRHLPDGCTIIGTTTDVLKISGTGLNNAHPAVATASLISAANTYTTGGTAFVARPIGTGAADVAGGLLTTTAVPFTVSMVVDNAANAAAGTGIRLSLAGATALIAVELIYEVNSSVVRFEDVMLGGAGRNFYIR